jgi:hypothetical protein
MHICYNALSLSLSHKGPYKKYDALWLTGHSQWLTLVMAFNSISFYTLPYSLSFFMFYGWGWVNNQCCPHMKIWAITQVIYIEYFSKMYNIRICTLKKLWIQWTRWFFFNNFLFIFSFDGCAFFGFQTHTNHRICTKVRNTFPTFGINFSNHKPASLENI